MNQRCACGCGKELIGRFVSINGKLYILGHQRPPNQLSDKIVTKEK